MMLMPLKYQCITLVYTNLHKYRENGDNLRRALGVYDPLCLLRTVLTEDWT